MACAAGRDRLVGAHRPRRDVQGGVYSKEVGRLQVEAHGLNRHHWPVLGPGNVGHPKGVPDDHVLLVDLTVLQWDSNESKVYTPPTSPLLCRNLQVFHSCAVDGRANFDLQYKPWLLGVVQMGRNRKR